VARPKRSVSKCFSLRVKVVYRVGGVLVDGDGASEVGGEGAEVISRSDGAEGTAEATFSFTPVAIRFVEVHQRCETQF
jgi:hypothetical protein